MAHYNIFRSGKYRFISEDEYREKRVLQRFFNSKVLNQFREQGGGRGKVLPVEFFFYTDDEDKAINLAIEISKLHYEISGIDRDRSDNKWQVKGRAPIMKMENKTLTKWSKQMVDLGYENDCDFDGWNILL
ncbi:MAG: ribonuclease E inhibitor RraB [Chitinophagales bacterium]|nr:ribonuclease E inhibitor RraB [Chitinophagales bacterium]